MSEKPKRRISELIRAGAALRPMARGRLFFGGGSCALGCAYEAMFGNPDYPLSEFKEEYALRLLIDEFPILKKTINTHPFTCTQLSIAIAELNDFYGLTREEIADWVEQIEAEEAAKEMRVDRFLAERNPEPVLA